MGTRPSLLVGIVRHVHADCAIGRYVHVPATPFEIISFYVIHCNWWLASHSNELHVPVALLSQLHEQSSAGQLEV